MEVMCLGAGQDVGRSCIVVTIGDRRVMLDCGLHMGFSNENKFPDFSRISPGHNLNGVVDCVIVSHFHLDHCGALPYLTEQCGYRGPVYMTHPTLALSPLLLKDYARIMQDSSNQVNGFTDADIDRCLGRCTGVNLLETVFVDGEHDQDGLRFKAYYAGHVLGAAIFAIWVGETCLVYTGDFNMTPDRHLGPARIERLQPDLLITESTYATTTKDSRRHRERMFLQQVQTCLEGGGKVLIPVFALGRAQELCILLESHWRQMGLTFPIYFTPGLSQRANHFYRLFLSWTNENIQRTFETDRRNMFNFDHIDIYRPELLEDSSPKVVFATPGMLNAGTALEIFKAWAGDARNLVVMPGYCVRGTVGAELLQKRKTIKIPGAVIKVECSVMQLSFSAHADSKGILAMLRLCAPNHVMLVHGEKEKMIKLRDTIQGQLSLSVDFPPNFQMVPIPTRNAIRCLISPTILERALRPGEPNPPQQPLTSSVGQKRSSTDPPDDDAEEQKNVLEVLQHVRCRTAPLRLNAQECVGDRVRGV